MAANFGAGATEARDLGTNITPKEGIVKEPVIAQGVSDVFTQVGDALKARKQSRNEGVISDFIRQQILVAEGVQQGAYKSPIAQARIRQNLLNAVDANRHLTSELVKAHQEATGLLGVEEFLSEGTETEQRDTRRFNQLVDANLLDKDASPTEFRKVDEATRVAQAASDRYKLRSESIKAERDALDLGSARRAVLTEKLQDEANQLVAATTPAEIARIQGAFEGFINSDLPVAEKVNAIRDFTTNAMAQAAEVLGNVDSARKEQVDKLVGRLEQDYIDRATGKITDAALQASKTRIQTQLEVELLANPYLARAAAVTSILGPEAYTQLVIQSGNARNFDAVNNFLGGANPDSDVAQPSFFTNDKVNAEAMVIALDALAEGVQSSDPSQREEATRRMQTSLQNMEDNVGHILREPKKAIALVNWLASPAFLKARTANPDAFDDVEGLSSILDDNYHDEVRGMIANEFTEAKVFVRTGEGSGRGSGQREAMPTNQLVEAVGTEGGMTFRPIDTDNPQARKEAARLNKVLKPIINNSIKAQTHLGGKTNYKQAWEETSEAIFGVSGEGGDDQVPGGDAGDDLTMADYAADETLTRDIPLSEVDKDWTVGRAEGVEPKLIDLLSRVRQETGINFRLNEGKRTTERQKKLVASGASQTMNSKHLHGNATDIVILNEDGSANWNFEDYRPVAEAAKRIAKEMGIDNFVWGGDWKSLRDGVHFQLG